MCALLLFIIELLLMYYCVITITC